MAKDKRLKWRRINGLSWPLDPLQLVAWLFTLLFAFIYFGILIPALPHGPCQWTLIVLMASILSVHAVLHVLCNVIDPADPEVRSKKQQKPLPKFSHKEHAHVIENQYCHICEVKVDSKSKHCSACNKCVDGFDHHCRWLNNCVGRRNYRLFLACVSTALGTCFLFIIMCIICAVKALATVNWPCLDHQELKISRNGTESTLASNSSVPAHHHYLILVPVTKQFWISITLISLVLAVIAFLLLVHLLGFHVFLIFKGFSTYEYILRERDAENEDKRELCDKKKHEFKCSLSQSNKKISPHKPSSMEMQSKSDVKNTHHLMNGAAQPKKETLSVNKDGLCSSGGVYIGSPMKGLRKNSSQKKLQELYQDQGFDAGIENRLQSERMFDVNDGNEISDENDDDEMESEVHGDSKESFKSRSPSLNNLMVDDDDAKYSDTERFDDIVNCKEVPNQILISEEMQGSDVEETYVHHIDENDRTIYSRNNNVESDVYHKRCSLGISNVVQNGRSLSLDCHEGMMASKTPSGVNNRRCSVEIHNLHSKSYVSSLTPLENDKLSDHVYIHSKSDGNNDLKNQQLFRAKQNHIV